jgi:hypothetical protein
MTDVSIEPHDLSTHVIERALLYAKSGQGGDKPCESLETVDLPELGMVLESRLANASRLIRHTLWYPGEYRNVLHSIAALDHLICEALELCWAMRELGSTDAVADAGNLA